MSSSIDTASLIAGMRAIQMGYAKKQNLDPDQVICLPWTRRDISDMYYIKGSLDWLLDEIKSGFTLTEERHGWTMRNIMALDRALTDKAHAHRVKFNPYHKPAGSPNGTGGQFDHPPGNGGGGGSSGGGSAPSHLPGAASPKVPLPTRKPHVPGQPVSTGTIDRTVGDLEKNAKKGPTGWCAQHVREALGKNGITVNKPAVRPGKDAAQARDYGPKLTEAGFKPVISSTQPAVSPDAGSLRKGDVVVIQPTSRNEAGHVAMYNGHQWISDYKQPGFWPGDAYRSEKPSYVIYRLPAEESSH